MVTVQSHAWPYGGVMQVKPTHFLKFHLGLSHSQARRAIIGRRVYLDGKLCKAFGWAEARVLTLDGVDHALEAASGTTAPSEPQKRKSKRSKAAKTRRRD